MPLSLPFGLDENYVENYFQTVEEFEMENRDSLNTAYQAILSKGKILPKISYDSFVIFVYNMI